VVFGLSKISIFIERGATMSDLSSLFKAKSLAIVGASTKPKKLGHIVLRNILESGYEGNIYPINPKADEICGLKCYPSLLEAPSDFELVIIIIPAQFVAGIIDEAGKMGAKSVIVISGGFREAGKKELEQEIKRVAEVYGIRLLGPNCQGLNYTPNKICATWPLIKKKGNIAIISQSGSVGAEMGILAEREGIGVSSIVSLGNKADITEIDLLKYFALDDNTKVIAMYIEAFTCGQAFLDVVSKVSKQKPVVILKPGKTKEGRKAAETHTNSLTGNREVFEAVCNQYGLVFVDSIDELYDCSKALSMIKMKGGKRVQIITSTGGGGVLASDSMIENGLQFASISITLKEQLKRELPSHFTISNPLDLTGDATAKLYEDIIQRLSNEKDIDIFLPIIGDPIPEVSKVFTNLKDRIKQDIIVCFFGGGKVQEEETLTMHESGLPVFPSPERAVKAIAKILKTQKW
jgi:acetyl coenzyme A synthetase (ADP forming)-like protein